MLVEVTVVIDEGKAATIRCEISGVAERVEEETRRLLNRVGQVVLERGFAQVANSVRGPMCCGRCMENRGHEGLTIQTTCGEVYVARTRYRCRTCRRSFYPADAELCCGVHRLSRPLAKRICQLATLEHFPRLEQLLADQHGVHVGHAEMDVLVHDVGMVAEHRRLAEAARNPETNRRSPWPEAEYHPRRIYVSCDGIMYCTNQSEPDPQRPGQNRLLWQQMKVGCVYWEDDSGHWHKQMIWGRESPEEFGASLYRLACRCGYLNAVERIFSADGADWCWDIQAKYFSNATGILDWFHASEHLWAASRILHSDAPATKAWVEEAQQVLRSRGGKALTVWLNDQIPKLRRSKRAAVVTLRNYVQLRECLMDYPRYRSQEWQIGTGMIESTARQLVGLRLKGPGMHWTEEGALAMTALRAQDLNGNWHSFWNTLILVA